MKFLKIAIASLVVALLCQSFANAKLVYVNAAAPLGGDGTSWPTACRFLQDALDLTAAGDEVWVAAGTYYPDDGAAVTMGDRAASFTLKQDVKIYGGFVGGESELAQRDAVANVTMLSGEIWTEELYWSLHVVTLVGSAIVDGFTVTKGNANGESAPHNKGGGIYSPNTNELKVSNCMFSHNTAFADGGAIFSLSYSTFAAVTASNCSFSNNTAISHGGAISSSSSSSSISVSATNCMFMNNGAASGGALYSSNSLIIANSCTFASNVTTGSDGSGGAISGENAIMNCTFTGNTASSGGAISGQTAVTNCNFSSNMASSGGAIYGYYSTTVIGCTFSNNVASSRGGAIYTSSSISATNCVFVSNLASFVGGALFTSSGSISVSNSTFNSNRAISGGACHSYNSSASTISAVDCLFLNNSASSDGGAISSASTTAANCQFLNNSTISSGGAIFSNSIKVTNCNFSANAATDSGGAIAASGSMSPISVTNCILWGNLASSSGGAVYSPSTSFANPVTLLNCTVTDNVANGPGGKGGAVYSKGLVKIFNNIFWHSLAQAQSNQIYITSTGSLRNADVDFPSPLNQAVNLIKGGMAAITTEAGAVVSLGDTAVKILSADPLFVDAANPTGADGIWGTADDGLRLQATSPAIDLGLSMFLPEDAYDLDNDGNLTELVPVDLAGYDRIQRAALDLGAYEVGDSFQPIGIVAQPLNLTLLKYLEATFTVTATGYGLRYQWYLGNSGDMSQPITGATGNSYTTPELGTTASYWVRVSNALGFVNSQTATATVVPIIITAQPVGTVAAIGGTASLSVTGSGKGLTYQWYQGASGDTSQPVDGANQAGFTTAPLAETTSYWVRLTNAYGTLDSDTAVVTVVADPVAAALNKESNLVFSPGGNAPWFAQSATTRDGVAATQSGAIAHSQSSTVQTTVDGPGTLSFWWNVSSQSGGDYLRFYVDGVEQSGSISGTTGTWAQKSFTVTAAGAHTFKWSYTKNSSTTSGSDCGWVDEVVWSPKLITSQPAAQSILSGMSAGLSVSASGTSLSYQWLVGESGVTTSPVTGATGPILTTPALHATTQYWVKVGNGVGFESSTTATITVFPPDSAVASALNSGPGVSYFTWGAMPWIGQSSTTHDGVSAMQSGAISHSQTSVLEGVVDGNGTLSFWWKVSSELGYDFLRFYIDDVELGNLSGETVWQQATFSIPGAGVHKLKWVYLKDESKTSGSDRAWLDQVSWQAASGATTIYQMWVTGYNLTGENALETADPAGDGVSNLVKYALSLDPHLPALAPTDGTHPGLPLLERVGDSVKFTFVSDTGKADVSYTVETCEDLATWQPVTAGVVETPLTGTLVRVVATMPLNGRRFCRLNVTK